MVSLAGGGNSSPPWTSTWASTSKGKAKMDAEAVDEAAEVWMCGICLATSREAIRGELDCCAHHFCFVCIMAWARVESRCPFCKSRFRTIRRPPVPGRFPSERIVPVPERNQVYHPQGNASSTVGGDPYAETSCNVCNCSRDDELMMLCDLCDSAAHTYCVGLGTVVPDGDWFCKDCTVSREEHLRCQADNEAWGGQAETEISTEALRAEAWGDQAETEISIEAPRAELGAAPSSSGIADEEHSPSSMRRTGAQGSSLSIADPVPSIYDIVDEDYTTNARNSRLGRNGEDLPSEGTSSVGSQCPQSTRGRDNGLASYHALIRLEVERARTLRNSRNLDKRIRTLRENWPALRDGSVGFSKHVPSKRTIGGSGTGNISVVAEHQRCATPVVGGKNGFAATSVQLSSIPISEETSASLDHGNKISQKDTRDARKAWKMLQVAKSSGGKNMSNKLASLKCSPPFSMGNRSTSCSPIDKILGQKNQNLPNEVNQKTNGNHGRHIKLESTTPTKNFRECCSLPENNSVSVYERMISFQNRMNQESLNGKVASSIQNQHVGQTIQPLCSTGSSEKFKSDMLHPLKCSLSPGLSTVTSSQQLGPSSGSQSTMVVNYEDSSAVCVATTDGIGSTATATMEVRKCSGSDRHERKRKLISEKCHDQGSKRSRSTCKIAKSKISSLAIRELKLLKIDKTYGSDIFREVARTTTDTALAACGFEHSPSRSLALSGLVCRHSSEVKLLKSSVIDNSCTECLCNFVKEAIRLVLSDRQMDQTGASC